MPTPYYQLRVILMRYVLAIICLASLGIAVSAAPVNEHSAQQDFRAVLLQTSKEHRLGAWIDGPGQYHYNDLMFRVTDMQWRN